MLGPAVDALRTRQILETKRCILSSSRREFERRLFPPPSDTFQTPACPSIVAEFHYVLLSPPKKDIREGLPPGVRSLCLDECRFTFPPDMSIRSW